MDGVERVMVLGIFAVIVAILSIAAWGVTDEDGGSILGTGADGGLVADDSTVITSAGDTPVANAKNRTGQRSAGSGGAPGNGGGAPKAGSQDPAARGSRPPQIVQGGPPRLTPQSAPPRAGRDLTAVPLKGGTTVTPRPKNGTQGAPQGTIPASKPTFVTHKVVKGDTVWSIVREHFGEGDVKAQIKLVAQNNPAIDLDHITPGDVLQLPVEAPEGVVTKPIKQQATAGTRLYTIGAGETLTHIADKQLGDGKRANEIYQLNRKTISHPDKVFEGMTILLPVR